MYAHRHSAPIAIARRPHEDELVGAAERGAGLPVERPGRIKGGARGQGPRFARYDMITGPARRTFARTLQLERELEPIERRQRQEPGLTFAERQEIEALRAPFASTTCTP